LVVDVRLWQALSALAVDWIGACGFGAIDSSYSSHFRRLGIIPH
jgi:hypothetical protein